MNRKQQDRMNELLALLAHKKEEARKDHYKRVCETRAEHLNQTSWPASAGYDLKTTTLAQLNWSKLPLEHHWQVALFRFCFEQPARFPTFKSVVEHAYSYTEKGGYTYQQQDIKPAIVDAFQSEQRFKFTVPRSTDCAKDCQGWTPGFQGDDGPMTCTCLTSTYEWTRPLDQIPVGSVTDTRAVDYLDFAQYFRRSKEKKLESKERKFKPEDLEISEFQIQRQIDTLCPKHIGFSSQLNCDAHNLKGSLEYSGSVFLLWGLVQHQLSTVPVKTTTIQDVYDWLDPIDPNDSTNWTKQTFELLRAKCDAKWLSAAIDKFVYDQKLVYVTHKEQKNEEEDDQDDQEDWRHELLNIVANAKCYTEAVQGIIDDASKTVKPKEKKESKEAKSKDSMKESKCAWSHESCTCGQARIMDINFGKIEATFTRQISSVEWKVVN